MIWPLPGIFSVIAVDRQETLRVSQLSGIQQNNGNQEGHPELAKTGIGPAALRLPPRRYRMLAEPQVTKPRWEAQLTGKKG